MLLTASTVLVIIAGGFLAWQGYHAIMHADLFVISGVDVKGVKQVSEADLKGIAGIFSGQNIFRVDVDAAARRARLNPWVKEVRIYRRLPNRITMVFTERVPSFVLDAGTGRYLLDSEGVVIEGLGRDHAGEWPLPVIAIHNCRTRPGEQVIAEALPDAMQLIAEIAARGGWQMADVTVKADSPDALAVVYGGYQFKIGSGRYGEKLRRLAEIMADVKERGLEIAYVDLRPERQAAVLVKKQGQGVGDRKIGRKGKS